MRLTNFRKTRVREEYRYPRTKHYPDLLRDQRRVEDISTQIGCQQYNADMVV